VTQALVAIRLGCLDQDAASADKISRILPIAATG
jgi:hypothetical protein